MATSTSEPADQASADETHTSDETFNFVVVSNRLPVDRVTGPDGEESWRRSPGGLVTALSPVMENNDGAWIGWSGAAGDHLAPFDEQNMHLHPVSLSEEEIQLYYEGFSNGCLWPLYHDVIAPPEFHRTWWDAYKKVNRRFAEAAANIADQGATVWVQDYQLQLVPKMLRELRPDLKIGFFNHIPFPPLEIFAQLPWRKAVLEGLLGADLIGFQRDSDAANFRRSVTRFTSHNVVKNSIHVGDDQGVPSRIARAAAFPISIDMERINELTARPDIQERARQIREDLGNPKYILLGVDRLDYTKGIRHRLKAYEELLNDARTKVGDVTLVQVASPSRERVEQYRLLREEIESTVGRINGTFDTTQHSAVRYLHHSYPIEEMIALYMAADVMLVTALRDGMNLVAKEYVASRIHDDGVLVLSEFAGAADTLKQAILINPHDIDGMKEDIVKALTMDPEEKSRRMRVMRRIIATNDVEAWSKKFLEALNSDLDV
ncbi:alpha,alpha-trehalose-phosphate synthase (UDP-forming) [Haematomicrobium sanguinis]|uniref:alpha,alpha-trehalose-phosphate synthase (UDP-forming) n=1 Tax=Haematomicrobium sanguinis TaxID=479106 RepID=UPI00047A5BD3|nr:alpha,alpha-trehalose-phosphate synthase (UDP-forming) [Haematomicrobium sanguinis]